jgi:hypothetical protein
LITDQQRFKPRAVVSSIATYAVFIIYDWRTTDWHASCTEHAPPPPTVADADADADDGHHAKST